MSTERDQSIKIESPKEPLVLPGICWLAGALEASGNVSFRIRTVKAKGHEYLYCYPLIELCDRRWEYLSRIRHSFDGSIFRSSTSKTNEWRLCGYKAAEVLISMRPYLRMRAEMAYAAENWLSAGELEERILIAEEVNRSDPYAGVVSESYIFLLEQPEFMAGVLDNKGIIVRRVRVGRADATRVLLGGRNDRLLGAIYNKYGGSWYVIPNDEPVTIYGRSFVPKNDSSLLALTSKGSKSILEFVSEYSLIAQMNRSRSDKD